MKSGKFGYRLREVRVGDAPHLFGLAKKNQYHSTNFLQDICYIRSDVECSLWSFRAPHSLRPSPGPNLWMFVLEDAETGTLVGSSLIKEISCRLYYEIKKAPNGYFCGALTLSEEPPRVFELGGFLLDQSVRGQGLAPLLSYGRLMFLDMMEVPVRRLLTEFTVHPVSGKIGVETFWERWFTPFFGGLPPFHGEFLWRDRDFLRSAFHKLPRDILFNADYGDLFDKPSIHPVSGAARHLLTKVGFRPAHEVEANGCVWYEADWSRAREVVKKAHVPISQIIADECGEDCHPDSAILAERGEDGFAARYIPVKRPDSTAEKPAFHVSRTLLPHISGNARMFSF